MSKKLNDFTVDRTDTIRTAMLKITANRYRVVVVLDRGKVVGTVSDGDIRRAFLKDVLPLAPVEKIMNVDCASTTERDPQRLGGICRQYKITVLPIVNQENDLLDVFLAFEPFFDSEDVNEANNDDTLGGEE